MADALICAGMAVGFPVLAIALLAIWDARRRRRQQEQTPVAERIAGIHRDAAFMIGELQAVLDRHVVERPETVAWIPRALEYYRRLEALASSADASAEQASQLAEEASEYVREYRIKGIFVAREGPRVGKLLRGRDGS
jgi:hypothetical protein